MDNLPHLTGLTSALGKDGKAERRLAELNDLLEPTELALRARAQAAPQRPIVFVLGPPRSGTTLLSQILAASGGFATISNFTARFWKAPALGLKAERALGVSGAQDFLSERGVTRGFGAPHEFGYFWSSWFDLGQETHAVGPAQLAKVNVAGLQRALAAMEAAVDAPLAFKNNTWFTFQADWLARNFPTGVFVACIRDPFFVAQSLYEQRLALGDLHQWWSIRPSAYRELTAVPPLEQVAGQAVEIALEMEKSLASVPQARLIRVNYEKLCDDPHAVLGDVLGALDGVVSTPPRLAEVPRRFDNTDRVRLPSAVAEELKRLVELRLSRGLNADKDQK